MTADQISSLRAASKKRTRSERASPDSAGEVLRAIVPSQTHRAQISKILSEAIQTAHRLAPAGWSVTLFDQCIRLNVGKVLVLDVLPNLLWLAADTEALTNENREAGAPFLVEEKPSDRLPPTTAGYAAEAKDADHLARLVAAGHVATLQAATADHSGKPSAAQAWSPGVIELLERELKVALPRPTWDRGTLVTAARRKQLNGLFGEFETEYLDSKTGKQHVQMYRTVNAEGPSRLATAGAADPDATDGIDTVLANLLPHNDTTYNRGRGAWAHYAPAVTRDLRVWFEGARWTAPEAWPQVCRSLVGLYRRLEEQPEELDAACKEFAESPVSKGFGAGILSPLLHALHPDRFLLLNNKSRGVVNWLVGSQHGHTMTDYPAANTTALELVAELEDQLKEVAPEGLSAAATFDIFTHWLVAVRKLPIGKTHYWKIAPGRDAHRWDDCRDGGFILIGWEKLGDLSDCSRSEYETRRNGLVDKKNGYTRAGMDQVWRFRNIREGDWIVANRGTKEVLGVGLVTGSYYFIEDDQHGHRLPVQWTDVGARVVDQGGWRKTITELKRETFEAVSGAPPLDPSGAKTPPVPPKKSTPEVVPHDDAALGPKAFELLKLLDETPRREVYAANKAAFSKHLEEPFKALFQEVIKQLPPAMLEGVETRRRLFGQIPKNDWGQGGAWPYYWGAVYPEDARRTEGAQLFLSARPHAVSFGFAVGELGAAARERFAGNVQQHREALATHAADLLDSPQLVFGSRKPLEYGGDLPSGEAPSGPEWLRDLDTHGYQVVRFLHPAEVLATPREDLVASVVATFREVWPLFLLAARDDPSSDLSRWWDDIEDEAPEEEALQPRYTPVDVVRDTHLPPDRLESWLAALERKGQAVLYGPPGTGKTWVARALARHLVSETTGIVDLVQFHPAYAYEDFMQGIRPVTKDGKVGYEVVAGRFLDFCRRARDVGDAVCVLIVDEINRANLSRVFGELMYLLEYRAESIPLSGGGRFSIPNNVRVIGTMNTADRSIALVDHALRRRFAFLPLEPMFGILTSWHASEKTGFDTTSLIKALTEVNAKIDDPNYSVGISFFLRPKLASEIEGIWRMEIEPYLAEYFFDRPGVAKELGWDRMKDKLQP